LATEETFRKKVLDSLKLHVQTLSLSELIPLSRPESIELVSIDEYSVTFARH